MLILASAGRDTSHTTTRASNKRSKSVEASIGRAWPGGLAPSTQAECNSVSTRWSLLKRSSAEPTKCLGVRISFTFQLANLGEDIPLPAQANLHVCIAEFRKRQSHLAIGA